MKKMSVAHVLVVGLKGLGVEIGKKRKKSRKC
jgi:molybdopterin/thiamine biosynthesis adenylyltransferase